jgi:hypothetical protein
MKKISFLLAIVFFLSCKKDKESEAPQQSPTSSSIANLWELQINISATYLNGNLYDADTTYDVPGESWVRFDIDNTYVEYEESVPSDMGNYTYNNNTLILISGTDSITYTTTLTPTSLILQNTQSSIFPPDTMTYNAKLTFKKI